MVTLLEVRKLTIEYSDHTRVAHDISFDIHSGEVVGVLGESGCGKTSLARSLLGLLPPSARVLHGSILFAGRDIVTLSESELRELRGASLSMIFQEPAAALNPVMRVGVQVAEVIRAHGGPGARLCDDQAISTMELVHLPARKNFFSAYPHQLSGGQRQRVVTAQALAAKPHLVVADEPTSSLDSITQAEIIGLFRELKERLSLAMLFITHHPAILSGLADRVLVMYAGRIVEQGSLQSIYQNPRHPYTVALLRSLPSRFSRRKTPLPTVTGPPAGVEFFGSGCPFEHRCPDRLPVCSEREPEEIRMSDGRRLRCFRYEN